MKVSANNDLKAFWTLRYWYWVTNDKSTAIILTFQSHCWNCLVVTKRNPYPCEQCSGVVYCSTECQKEADQTYHR